MNAKSNVPLETAQGLDRRAQAQLDHRRVGRLVEVALGDLGVARVDLARQMRPSAGSASAMESAE